MNKYYKLIRAKRNEVYPQEQGFYKDTVIAIREKPVSLREAFTLLPVKCAGGTYTLTATEGDLGYVGMLGYEHIKFIDLTKSFKDQDPEVHEAVWELIKE